METATAIRWSRVFSMPSADTFDMKCIHDFVWRYLNRSKVSIDPFARNKRWATYTNDLNPDTKAEHHLDAADFCKMVEDEGWQLADLGIFDPPYSPGQIVEVYDSVGIDTANAGQNGALYRRVRSAMDRVIVPGGIVLSFGWNSAGMGKGRGYEIVEIMLVTHGGAHNDTICMAERKLQGDLFQRSPFL